MRRVGLRAIAAAVLVGAVLTACRSTSSSDGAVAATSSISDVTPTGDSVLPSGSTPAAPTPIALPAAPAPLVSTPVPSPVLERYGALIADWNSAHTMSPSDHCDPGACYGPDPNLPQLNGHIGYDYTLITPIAGRILTYTLNLPDHTAVSAAQAAAALELPADSTVTWTATLGNCLQTEYASATLGGILGGDDPGGYVFAEFQSPDNQDGLPGPWSPTDVTAVTFQPGPLFTTLAAAPPC